MTTYTETPTEVLSKARDLINEHHPHLELANIGFIFRDEPASSKGKSVYVQVRRPPAWFVVFEEYDFIIEIAESYYADLSDERRDALIDHALCFCSWSDKSGWKIRPFDFEGFASNIDRFGFWHGDLLSAASTFRSAQEKLPGIEIGTPGNLKAVDPLKYQAKVREASGEPS